ncbi:DUF3016 domain-containing protein [Pseudomonas fluorescens]|uniref:DUF3016 domain-containing protein n=1 Tax=Pseudomonas fluorescens TaxID=294 RepID=A0A5E7F9M6_PSEFL|nr:DUF3016 domain-containing protein [Pseudomonas fluorescens]VVO34263.1 hypothetical protein PS691_05190 [Pseudomonas fluorescens]
MRATGAVTTVLLMLMVSMMQPFAATTSVEVSFKNPESYRDASLRTTGYETGADDYVMKQLRSAFEQLGKRYLQPGQVLQVEVSDIDLAGRYEPWHVNANQVRFMRDITWPSMKLHYVLKLNDQTIRQADVQLSDKFYLQRPGRAAHSDRLYAEKAMLADWFRTEFQAQHISGRK